MKRVRRPDVRIGYDLWSSSYDTTPNPLVALDLSFGMLRVARRNARDVPLIQADLDADLPVREDTFDAVLCALVGEHLTRLGEFFREVHRLLGPDGRMLFSVFHPDMAAAGIEANFEQQGVEYRLGAERHSVADYLTGMQDAGFADLRERSFCGDRELAREVPGAEKYLDRPLLLLVEGRRVA